MDKEHKAVERLRLAAEMSETYSAKPPSSPPRAVKIAMRALRWRVRRASATRYSTIIPRPTRRRPSTM